MAGKEEILLEEKNVMLIKERDWSSNHKRKTAVYNVLGNDYYWPDIKDHIKKKTRNSEISQKYNRRTRGRCDFISTTRYLRKNWARSNRD